MNRLILLILLIFGVIFNSSSSNILVSTLKKRIVEISKNYFFRDSANHVLATNISNKGNTTDLSLRELYWNTYQSDFELDNIINTQNTDGSWKNINYFDTAKSNWQPTNHVSNLLYLSRAYITPNSKFYQKNEVSKVLHRGLNFWFRSKPICKNWWYNEISTPRFLGLVFLFIENELTPQEKAEAIAIMNKSGFRMTGQNKVWLAGNVLIKSLLTDDLLLAKEARNIISSEIYTTTTEGIQPDYSFHQHGPQQQFGNYGLSFISSMAYYANVFGETTLAFSSKQIDILRNYIFEGQNWIVWRGNMDVSACNRQLFKQTQVGKALSLCVAVAQLKQADLANSQRYDDLILRNMNPENQSEKSMSKHFWRSDLTVYRTSNYYISIRSCSPRLIGTEFVNNENKKGHFISDGCTIFMQRGNEYSDIFPIWDWNRLPGVTASIQDSTNGIKTDNYRNANAFVGGLTYKKNGISTFSLDRNGLKAHKSWFNINGVLVCLGSDIRAKNGKEIITGVNQQLKKGMTFLGSLINESISLNDTIINSILFKTVWHDSIGYCFPKQTNISLSVAKQTGNWHEIADPYSSDKISGQVFKLWINHGLNALKSPTYEYFVLPNVSHSKFIEFSNKPTIEVTANNSEIQSVKSKDNFLYQFVFHKPLRVETFSKNDYLETKSPGLVFLERNKLNNITLIVADPTQNLKEMMLIVNGKYEAKFAKYDSANNVTELKIPLPQFENAGSSMTVMLDKKLKNIYTKYH